MREHLPCVYMMASGYNGTLYVGVTSNLIGRVMQHRQGTFGGFTARYGVTRLVWFEGGESMEAAIARENPMWNGLAEGLGLEPLAAVFGGEVDSGTRPG